MLSRTYMVSLVEDRRYMKRKAGSVFDVGFEYCHGCFTETLQMASAVGNVPVAPQLVFA